MPSVDRQSTFVGTKDVAAPMRFNMSPPDAVDGSSTGT
jgi:hypothetical protein